MKPLAILLCFLATEIFFLATPATVLATDPPNLISPANGSSVTSATLNWGAPSYNLYPTNPYRMQVDDDPLFTSIDKDYYTANTHYSPALNLGSWYWRVKAKNASNTWSSWSDVWGFTLADASPTPTTPPPTSTPIPTPTSTPTPTPTDKNATSFTTSLDKIDILSSEPLTAKVQISGLGANSSYFLKGAFVKSGSTNYFGKTKVANTWVKNNQTYSSQLPITTDASGSWSGSFQTLADNDDSGFKGSGDYIFKVARYDDGGTGPFWSNQTTVNITAPLANDDQTTHSRTDTPISSSETSPTISESAGVKYGLALSKKAGNSNFNPKSASSRSGDILAASNTSATKATIKIQSQEKLRPLLFWGSFLILTSGAGLAYLWKKH